MNPISFTSSAISVITIALQILKVSQSYYGFVNRIDRYLNSEPESVTESHIRTKHGALILNAIRFLMPDLSSQLKHIDQYVLHDDDNVLLKFRKSYINDCNMTSVAMSLLNFLFLSKIGSNVMKGAIVTQVAITALSLPYLSQTHWVARACFVISLISGTLSVFFAVLLQRIIGSLYEALALRAWLSSLDTYPNMKDLKEFLQQSFASSASDTSQRDVEAARVLMKDHFANFDLQQRKIGFVSVVSTLILETSRSMINISLGSFLTGLAVYFGFLWTRDLDANAGPGDSRNVFIIFSVAVLCCIGMYSVPRGIKRKDEYVASVYSRIRSTLDLMNIDDQSRARNESNEVQDHSPPEAARGLPPDGDAEVDSNKPSVEVLAPEVRGPPPASPQNTVSTAALRRAMQAHRELSAAELALSREYANILAAAQTERNTAEDLYD